MNRFLWFLVNLSLVAAFCGVAMLVARSDPRSRWDTIRQQAVAEDPAVAAKPPAPVPVVDEAVASRDVLDGKTLETLWRRSLFRPDRTEDVAASSDEAKPDEGPPADEWLFELKATAILDTYRAAIIQIDPAKRAPARNVRVVHPVRRPGVPPVAPSAAPPEGTKKPKRLFREGDALNETGYVLVEVRSGEVTIRKGEDEKVLVIDRVDPGSLSRRDAAAEAAEAAAKTAPPDENQNKEKEPPPNRPVHTPPPPPPGGPGGPGTLPSAALQSPDARVSAREAGRKRLAEEHMKSLEKARSSRTTNGGTRP